MSDPCLQQERILRMEIVVDGTAKQLATNNIILTRIETLLQERILKYDDHIEKGATFRAQIVNTLVGVIVSLVVVTASAIYAYGGIAKQVEVNTVKWEHLENK